MNIDILFDGLMHGNGSLINVENINLINQEALKLYNKESLSPKEIDELKKIVMICNVLYNRTDMSILPVEDGFYDLLLEKYKTYDDHFQVGSAIVDFRNIIENDLTGGNNKIARCPISFFEQPNRDEIHQSIYDDIMRTGKPILNYCDLSPNYPIEDIGNITKRSHNTKHNHPSLVGTLDKCKFVTNQDAIDAGAFDDPNVKILERDFFQYHINSGVINPRQELTIVCELKYDGVSVEADCKDILISARSRGDTGIGEASDITPILYGYRFKHADFMKNEDEVGVKFEAIMTKSNLALFNQMRGKSYANCRTAIIGLFGASDAYKFRDLITLVPLALDREEFKYPIANRIEEIEFLNKVFVSHGEPLRYAVFTGTIPELLFMTKAFLDEAKLARSALNFLYDGIVVSYLDEGIREKLGRKNFINKYSMAVKFDAKEKQTIFRGYTYTVGQHGNITPMFHYDPVEFMGTIHTKSTGSSLDRFNKMGLRYGDIISVKYVNDVMPYVSRLECDHNRKNTNPIIQFPTNCPICGASLVISKSGQSIFCPNEECPARSVKRMTNMFAKLNIKGFADATFGMISEIDHLYKLYEHDLQYYVNKLGVADGNNLMSELEKLKSGVKDYIIMGSLGFTSMAHLKWQSILQYIKLADLYSLYQSCSTVDEFRMCLYNVIPGIGEATCNTITNEFNFFEKDILFIINNINIFNSYGTNNPNAKQIRFTGFRNQQLSEQLITLGYDADCNASVTKKTDILLVPYDGFVSAKVEKAKANDNTKIIPVDEFVNNMDKYLN